MSDNQFVDGEISRRVALRRGLRVGSALWVVPTVQVVTMTEAHAETASGPVSRQPDEQAEESDARRGVLPKTGAGLDPALAAAAGAALVAAGSATVAAQRRRLARAAAEGVHDLRRDPPADGPR
jgi:LPXTG-motif cell wall-anchored protein